VCPPKLFAMPVRKKSYSEKEKAAYWKKKATAKAKRPSSSRSMPRSIRPTLTGHGDYYQKDPRRYYGQGSALGGALGAAVGTAIAPGVGTALGLGAGALLGYAGDKIFGWGDYTIEHNTLAFGTQAPLFDGPEYVRVIHREYIGDINSTVAFDNRSYGINPGNNELFPWLSPIAEQFEQYRFNGLLMQFVSTSASALNSTNTALGNMILATDYDAADPAYKNQQQMLSTTFANSGAPCANILHAVECDPASIPTKWLYVRSSSVNSGTDARLYDLGKFQLATYGSQAAAVVGQLWVTYDVTFQKKQMNNILGLALKSCKYNLQGVTTANYFAGASYTAGSNLPLSFSTDGSSFAFPELLSGGNYLVTWSCRGVSTANLGMPNVVGTNCTLLNIWDAGTKEGTISTTTSTICEMKFIVSIENQGAYCTFSLGTLPGTPGASDFVVTQINGNILTNN